MTIHRVGEVVLVAFPFTSGRAAKQRPALVVLDTGDADLVVARVTTRAYQTAFDVRVADWRGAGLRAPSVVRLHKLATLERRLIARSLGSLGVDDTAAVAAVLRRAFGGWS